MNTDRLKYKEITNSIPIINYLAVTNIEVGLLLNFCRKPKFKRFVYMITKYKTSVAISVNLPAIRQAGLWLSR